jgi:hypothetical protein
MPRHRLPRGHDSRHRPLTPCLHRYAGDARAHVPKRGIDGTTSRPGAPPGGARRLSARKRAGSTGSSPADWRIRGMRRFDYCWGVDMALD